MSIVHHFLILTCVLVLLPWGLTVAAADYEPGTPSTYLFDTGKSSAGLLPGAKLNPKAGWALVPEDDLTHKFRGDAVVLNDRLAVVFRSDGTGAEVYGQTSAGAKYRVEISPRGQSGRKPTALSSVQILENGPAAVTLAAWFATAGGRPFSLKYRLTAGQMIVEVRPGQEIDRLAVLAETRYVVIPDYFGYDMIYGAGTPDFLNCLRLRLPAEKMLLLLQDEGNAEVMCVWPSNRQDATALLPSLEPGLKQFSGCEIQAVAEKPVWVACLEGAGLWHESSVATPGKKGQPVDWKPPFPAKWRVDVLEVPTEASSSWLADGAVIHENRANPPSRPLLVYAMDRTQATPLTTFTPIDILRGTLGVGPCQYILQTEGLSSDANPTPDNVMTWIEKQFSRKKEKKAADEIRERLAQMVEHVGQAQARIDKYGRMFAEVERLCDAAVAGADTPCARMTMRVHDDIGEIAGLQVKPPPAQRARQLADQVIGLIGTDGAAECEKIGGQLRALGAQQDRTLAVCRIKARCVRQSIAAYADDHPGDTELIGNVQSRIEELLRTK